MDNIRELTHECIGYITAGKLNIKVLVSATLPLSRVSDGLEMTMKHPEKYLKVIIDMECKL